jgi:muramoyltetrapeptide carboxypeptidase
MTHLPVLKKNDTVSVIALGSGVKNPQAELLKASEFLKTWELRLNYPSDLFSQTTDFDVPANSSEKSFAHFMAAINNPDIKVIFNFRGGRYTDQIMPYLIKTNLPSTPKLIVGFSDTSQLLNFLAQQWHWPSIHGPVLRQLFSETVNQQSKMQLKKLLFGEISDVQLKLEPLNSFARDGKVLHDTILVGGNLLTLESTIGTPWQFSGKHNIVILEDIDEAASKINRSLNHLINAGIFSETNAIILGDFIYKETTIDIKENDPKGNFHYFFSWANQNKIPILKAQGVGHGVINQPLCFGTRTELRINTNHSILINTTTFI